jgi:hypothetical protein
MSTMFFKKSLKFLAIAMAGLYNESSAAAFTDTVGVDPGASNVLSNQKNSVFSTTGTTGNAVMSGEWTLDANHQAFWNVASGDNTNPRGVAFTSIIRAGNNTKINILGNGDVDLSTATLDGPTGTNMAYFSLYTDQARFSSISGLAQKFTVPTNAGMTGKWTIESLMDGAVIDAAPINTAMPAFTLKATNSVYFGGIRGLSGATNSYATTFGNSASAIVTGPGIVKLGEAFTTFNPTWTAFTGCIETNSALTLGSSTYPVALNAGQNTATLILNSAHTVTLGSAAVALKKVISENDGAGLSAITTAVVSIAELDLSKHDITLSSPAGGSATFNIAKIADGSDKKLILNNAGTALTVNITAGRTDAGITRTGTTTGITITQP